MPTETQHLEQRVAALQSDLNERDQRIDELVAQLAERDTQLSACIAALREAGDYRSVASIEALSASAEQPAPVAAVHPFTEKVIRKLERFQECADDGQGADIGRHWFDLLTQLGLLNRVQRSPALWEMAQQGEDALELSRQSAKSR